GGAREVRAGAVGASQRRVSGGNAERREKTGELVPLPLCREPVGACERGGRGGGRLGWCEQVRGEGGCEKSPAESERRDAGAVGCAELHGNDEQHGNQCV